MPRLTEATTLSSLIQRVNETRSEHAVTIEEPIEFVYASDQASITQRQVGTHTDSYPAALRAALREDPETTMGAVWDFLGLEPLELGEKIEARNAAQDKTRVKPLWKKVTRVKPLLVIAKSVLPTRLRTHIRDKFRREKARVEGRFKLNDNETTLLETLYRDDLARLRKVYKVDISLWKI